jgi:SulP family sulfate permease
MGVLAGVSPVSGLYGYLFGTLAGAVATSSVLMSVQGTAALAVLVSDVPGVDASAAGLTTVVTLTVITGVIMLAAGLARAGSVVRFVPHSVVTGFVNAVAVTIVLSQLAEFTGYRSPAANRVARAVDTAANVASYDWPTVVAAVVTMALIFTLGRTRLGAFGMVVAIVTVSAVIEVAGVDSVRQVGDVAEIPAGIPSPELPDLALALGLLLPALSLAFVALIQGAAISQSVPNPDGKYPDVSGDFRGQGVANVVAGVFQGMPVGGSMSATGLLTAAGARSRWANVVAGAVMLLVILFFSAVASLIAMPALAGLLTVVGIRTFRIDNVVMVWRTGGTQASVMAVTFVLTIAAPLQFAVLAGVGISVALFVVRQSNKVIVHRWLLAPGDPFPREVPPPTDLAADEIVVLTTYGSLFFASAPIFEGQLPKATPDSRHAVVVIRLRGKEDLGSTFISVISRYQRSLASAGAFLVLAGVSDRVERQLRSTGAMQQLGEANVFSATESVGESLSRALRRADTLRASPTDLEGGQG